MKICIVCTRFDIKNLGGVERVVLDLSKQYTKKGHFVTIICKKEFNEPLNEIYKGIHIKRVKCIGLSLLKTISAYWRLKKLIKLEKADVYNPHDLSSGALFLFGKLKKFPYILTSNGFLGDCVNPPFFAKLVEKLVFKFTKAPIKCVQKFSKNTNYLEKDNVEYIPNGVDSDFFIPSKKNTFKEYALFVGSLDERKNIRRVCEAFSKNKLNIKVVGSGLLEKELKDKYSKFNNIKFVGRKRGGTLIKLFQGCKFFILPSTAEGFGLVWIEAQSCGKPIIATNVGAGPELIMDRDFGRLIKNPSNQKEIDGAILSLNNQIKKQGIHSKKIRKNVLSKYSWDVISNKYLNEFKLL